MVRRRSEVIRIPSLSGKTGIGGSNIHTIEQRMFLDNLVELSCRECLDEAEFLDAWKRGVPVIASEVQPVLDDERSTEPFAEPVAGWPSGIPSFFTFGCLSMTCSTTSIIKCRPIGCCSHRKAVERRNHKAFMAVTACCPLSGRALISLWEK